MYKNTSATDAKNNFGGLLDDVAAVGRVNIVKHGRLVAVVLSPQALESSVAGGVARVRDGSWGDTHDPTGACARRAHVESTQHFR